jgi:hypothetical protein
VPLTYALDPMGSRAMHAPPRDLPDFRKTVLRMVGRRPAAYVQMPRTLGHTIRGTASKRLELLKEAVR